MSTPFLIVGDAPQQKTGLSRILTDVLNQVTLPSINGGQGIYGLDIGVVGYVPWAHLPLTGTTAEFSEARQPYRQWAFSDISHWGREAVSTAYRAWYGNRPGVILTMWDPGRCHAFLDLDLPAQKWGYFAIDAENVNGGISGPAAEVIRAYDRVLAYTEFGKRVMRSCTQRPIDVLPHGVNLDVFTRVMTTEERARGIARLFPAGYPEGTTVIGCVATNQPRKDLGLFFRVIRELRSRDLPIHGWLHTDRLIGEAWSIPHLISDCDLEGHVTVTTEMPDRDLAVCYSLCTATIAPGRGEGFCYPIVESLGCGVPAFHCAYGGGAEWALAKHLIQPELLHLVGPYALARPILDPLTVAETILAEAPLADPGACHDAVRPLDWPVLWPEWKAWITEGLDGL